ncbi:MAG: dienelactone hydrolase family protein [Ktedonobacteraceae bacterium]
MIENNAFENKGNPHLVEVAAGALMLNGMLTIPDNARGIVLLSQGSRNLENIDYHADVAQILQTAGMATLFVRLLTEEEEVLDRDTSFFRFNVGILHQRIMGITRWLLENPGTQNLSIGYFGGDVTGAACLIAAAERPDPVHAIVVGNARTDLAQPYLARILAPTLLIAGENDTTMSMNREALTQLPATVSANRKLESIWGAAGLFETADLLQKVANLASQWFTQHLEPIV